MRFQYIHILFAWIMLSFFLFMPLANAVGLFSQIWSFPALGETVTHGALDSVGPIVYLGSSVTFGFTNYVYAVNISNGIQIWQYNTSLPINCVSHFYNDGNYFIAAGTGGSATQVSKSYVFCFNLSNNAALWQSVNLTSSVVSLGTAESYVSTGEDVVAGLENGTVVRLRGDTGNVLWSYPCNGTVFSISHLRNGSVIVGSRPAVGMGNIYCLEMDGSLRWVLEQNNRITLVKRFSDVNGDWEPDVIAIFYDNFVHVLNGLDKTEISPWPFSISGDYVKDLLCTEDYTGDGFPDIVCGTENGDLVIINGQNATLFRGPTRVSDLTVTYIRYMHFYENGITYLNKTLAISLLELGPAYYIRGINASDLTVMKEYQVVEPAAPARNLFNIGNFTSDFTGDLIFTANNIVYCISGTEIIFSEFSSQIVLVIIVILVWCLAIALRRERSQIN